MSKSSYRNFSGDAAELYEQVFVPAIATPVSVELMGASKLVPGERVLDVACGTGLIARLAAAIVGPEGSVTGVDLAPDMVEVARTIDAGGGAPIEWREGDAAALPFADESFDVVLCQMGIMFMDDVETALTEMMRVLSPGGRIVLNTPGRMQPAFAVMQQAISDQLDPALGGFVAKVFSMPDPVGLGDLLRRCGFAEVESRLYTADLDLPGPRDFLWEYIDITPMGPLVAGAPDAAKEAMERQVVEGWEPLLVDGRARFAQPMVLAVGVRPAR